MKTTPQAQMWFGIIVILLSLFTGIRAVTHPMAAVDWIVAYTSFSNVPLMAWVAWRGYQRLPKSEESAK
jgi:hypothetical protein